MLLVKANGPGIGYVTDHIFRNFSGHSNEYALNLDAAEDIPGEGLIFDRLTFSAWSGTVKNAAEKPPIRLYCPFQTPCGLLLVEDFNVWTETGERVVYACRSAFGIGACMNQFAGNGPYTSTTTVATMDAA